MPATALAHPDTAAPHEHRRDANSGAGFDLLLTHTPAARYLGTRTWTHNGRAYRVGLWLYAGRVYREVPLETIREDEMQDESRPGFRHVKAMMEEKPHRASSRRRTSPVQ